MKTPLDALKELNRLKRLKDAGLPYSEEEKQQAWKDAFEAEREPFPDKATLSEFTIMDEASSIPVDVWKE